MFVFVAYPVLRLQYLNVTLQYLAVLLLFFQTTLHVAHHKLELGSFFVLRVESLQHAVHSCLRLLLQHDECFLDGLERHATASCARSVCVARVGRSQSVSFVFVRDTHRRGTQDTQSRLFLRGIEVVVVYVTRGRGRTRRSDIYGPSVGHWR